MREAELCCYIFLIDCIKYRYFYDINIKKGYLFTLTEWVKSVPLLLLQDYYFFLCSSTEARSASTFAASCEGCLRFDFSKASRRVSSALLPAITLMILAALLTTHRAAIAARWPRPAWRRPARRRGRSSCGQPLLSSSCLVSYQDRKKKKSHKK